jgi:hypothetical protein
MDGQLKQAEMAVFGLGKVQRGEPCEADGAVGGSAYRARLCHRESQPML